ncbi:MAG: DNA topoisomerase IB [Cyclobacteriaceae bacterium]|nr:DNA topoisomerase IB [Cyclobacteriaceae bacterium]MCH8516264.1 DNA topoisomerase IB [Cyclobacteriaceae bacterium]
MPNKKDKIQEIDQDALCISKAKIGRGYAYYDENGEKIVDGKILKRLKSLVIPPMWSDVQICKFADGHIQATGRDAKGRKQYIYHEIYERQRQEAKFTKMLDFGMQLKEFRKQYEEDIQIQHFSKKKVVALVSAVLDECGLRIGNRQYEKASGTYGLSTLRRKHLKVSDDYIMFKYTGKSRQNREVYIDDSELITHIKAAADYPGYELFTYKDENNRTQVVDSSDVNDYIRNLMGEEFSCKDFRTWMGCKLALAYYPEALQQKQESSRKKVMNILIRLVADELGNTPSICKSYYIHPLILEKIDKAELAAINPFSADQKSYEYGAEEKWLMHLLENK